MEYRKDIQGLRAIAVLFVFIFHLDNRWLPGGFIGVDVFFVISGYLISSIILAKIDNNQFSFMNFYQSRIKRIVPAYYFLLIAIAVVGLFLLISTDIRPFRKSYFWAVLFNSNDYFASLDTYFGATSSENPLLHTWTLAVEMKFYLLLPFLLYFIKRKWLFGTIIFLTLILFGYSSFEIVNNNKNEMYYSLLSRTPEFFIGTITCLLLRQKTNIFKKKGLLISIFGFLLLFLSVFLINGNSLFPGALAIVPCVGAALLILAPQNQIRTFLSNKILVFIGELSYSLYLWHWPIIVYFKYYYNITELNILQVIIVVLLSVILSVFSYYCIETPLRKKKGIQNLLIISFLIVANVIGIVSIIPLSKKTNTLPSEFVSPSFGLESHANTFTKVQIFGDTVAPIGKKIFFTGDSHALCMKAYLDYIGRKNHFEFRTVTNNSYPLISNIPKEMFDGQRYYNQYLNLMQYAQEEINNSEIIILQYAGDGEKWAAPIGDLIKELNSSQSLIIFSDFPTPDKNPIRINRSIKNNITNISYELKYLEISNEIKALINSNSNCYYLDLSNSKILENGPFFNDTAMYYDRGHLNTYGAIKYAKDTETEFMYLLDSILSK